MKLKPIISKEEIKKRITELAKQISKEHKGKGKLLVIGVLKGSVIFLSDLIRELDLQCEIDFIALRSYDGKQSTGVVQVILDLYDNPLNKNVLIVEDILDTGRTLKFVKDMLLARKAKSVKICVLLKKKKRSEVKVDYKGFDVPNNFVVGYGLDYNEKFRNLAYIAVIE